MSRLAIVSFVAAALTALAGCFDAASQPCGAGFCRPGYTCTHETCVPAGPYCGDGHIDDNETCDDGVENDDIRPGACRSDCQPARCGDGVLDPGENPTCVRTAGAATLSVGEDIGPNVWAQTITLTPRAVATGGGSAEIALTSWDDEGAGTTVLTLPGAVRDALWWSPDPSSEPAQLLVLTGADRLHRIARVGQAWKIVGEQPLELGLVRALQPAPVGFYAITPERIVHGDLQLDPRGGSSFSSSLADSLAATDSQIIDARAGFLDGEVLLTLEDLGVARVLRLYRRDIDTQAWKLGGELPVVAGDEPLEIAAGVGSMGQRAPSVVLVYRQRIEIRDAQLAVSSSRPLPEPLAWARLVPSAFHDRDLVIGGTTHGIWVAMLTHTPIAPPAVAGTTSLSTAILPTGVGASDAALADLDRDGWPELVSRVGGRLAVVATGDGVFSSPVPFQSSLPGLIDDIDGDGNADGFVYAFFSNDLFWNEYRPDGRAESRAVFQISEERLSAPQLAACDADGDGMKELFVRYGDESRAHAVALRLVEGGAPETVWSYQDSRANVLAVADFAQDGACDALMVFDDGSAQLFSGRPGAGIVQSTDVGGIPDGSGLEEFAVYTSARGKTLAVLRTQEGAYWVDGARLSVLHGNWPGGREGAFAAALPGAFASSADGVGVLAIDADAAYLWDVAEAAHDVKLDRNYRLERAASFTAGDVNGDGHTDVVAARDISGASVFVSNGRATSATPFAAQPQDSEMASGSLADLNRDGAADWLSSNGVALVVRYGQLTVGARARGGR